MINECALATLVEARSNAIALNYALITAVFRLDREVGTSRLVFGVFEAHSKQTGKN